MIDAYKLQQIYDLYPNSIGWRRKVNSMPEYQILGIYFDRVVHRHKNKQKSKLDDNEVIKRMAENLKRSSKSEDIWRDKPTVYHCHICDATYSRDNDSLEYCELCNSKLTEE